MEMTQLQMMLKGCDVAAHFIGTPGNADLKWSLKVIDGLPDSIIPDLYRKYLRERKAGHTHNAKAANCWLRDRVTWFKALLRSFPVPIHDIRNEEHRAMVASDWANMTANILTAATSEDAEELEADLLFEKVSGPAEQWGFVPKMPKFQTVESKHSWMAKIMARLLDAAWWTRKINKAWDLYTEHAAILMGKVRRGVSPYISNKNLTIYRQRKAAARRWMQQMMVVNHDHQIEISLEEAISKSVSNPQLRRHELMVRMRGFEDTAAELGYTGLFITWTAPGKFHAWKQAANGKTIDNKKYIGATPQQTQRYLSSLWTKCRSALAREHIQMFGFRVAEPHHDGTPHWHMLLFVHPDSLPHAISILQRYALTDDKAELVRSKTSFMKTCPAYTDISARFEWKVMDPKEGGATGYIAKYIAKNLDGHAVGDDFEAETPAEEGAVAAGAWSCWHGIRQFQQIGGPSVSVWRECRRLKDPQGPSRDKLLEDIRRAADAANWRAYVDLMGGPVLPRADRPVKLLNIIKDAASKYGEDVKKVMGVLGLLEQRVSRLDGWVISKHGLDARELTGSAARQGSASIGRAEGAAPWSSDNNCTGRENSEGKHVLDQLSAGEDFHLGLDDWTKNRLKAGGIVRDGGRFIWMSGNEIRQSGEWPGEIADKEGRGKSYQPDEWDMDTGFEEEKTDHGGMVRSIMDGTLQIDKWIDDLPEKEIDKGLKALRDALWMEEKHAPTEFAENGLWQDIVTFFDEIAQSEDLMMRFAWWRYVA